MYLVIIFQSDQVFFFGRTFCICTAAIESACFRVPSSSHFRWLSFIILLQEQANLMAAVQIQNGTAETTRFPAIGLKIGLDRFTKYIISFRKGKKQKRFKI